MVQQPTVADLRRAGIITSQEVVAAIDAYMHNPLTQPYRSAISTVNSTATKPMRVARMSYQSNRAWAV